MSSNSISSALLDYEKSNPTPMMQQYIEIKKQYPDFLLFFRMGDFYELFFDDAITASKILDIALTKRNKENTIPMCGVPHHAHESYLAKLIKNNQKIVLCDQVETVEEAKKRGHKAIVKRDVIRIVTSGTITEENLLTRSKANFLMSIYGKNDIYDIAYADISTGEFYFNQINKKNIIDEINLIDPKEIIVCDNIFSDKALLPLIKQKQDVLANFPENFFQAKKSTKVFEDFYNVVFQEKFNIDEKLIRVIGSLIEYIKITQKANCPKLNFPTNASKQDLMELDNTTINHLEIFANQSGQTKKTLYNVINYTETAAGARKLREIICQPLTNIDKIQKRQNLISFFKNETELLTNIKNQFASISDIQRIISKISTNRASLRDFLALKQSIIATKEISNILLTEKNLNKETNLTFFNSLAQDVTTLINELNKIVQTEQNDKEFSNFIAPNISDGLDQLKALKNNTKANIELLESKYQKQTSISTLRIKSTNVWGFFVEINSKDYDKIDQSIFTQKQSLANATRFITEELNDFQNNLLNSTQKIAEIEFEILNKIRAEILNHFDILQEFASKIARLDVLCSLAIFANDFDLSKPEITNDNSLIIESGFHPVIKKYLPEDINEYTANDSSFDLKTKIKLLTGPNMAGKSTYLRQNAIIILLAQIGSFVPAKSAKIGIVDRIFSRIGAADDITQGRSTFMVEMIETATILTQATQNSFIILDEIGRGTSTYDGLSIAMAITQYLHDNIKARVIFATHYHELIDLESKLEFLKCYKVEVAENKNTIIFKHKVTKGSIAKSYGIMVVKLAGVPSEIIKSANKILNNLERSNNEKYNIENLPLFENDTSSEITMNDNQIIHDDTSKIKEKLLEINPDNLTPKQALELIYDLKNAANS
ncbi:DNA mismatch repair protein MutS [Rickettsiales bacterium]|nr:DNA mismatch repair protein MutS [Rickettsiales bacterium]